MFAETRSSLAPPKTLALACVLGLMLTAGAPAMAQVVGNAQAEQSRTLR